MRSTKFIANGLALAADIRGDESDPVVILLHGGGQTRHSWSATAKILSENGWCAVSVDLRGHGDSEWPEDADYGFMAFRDDVIELAKQFDRPALVGASLGGSSSMLALGESGPELARALVLVDITHRINPDGRIRISDFMASGAQGFASLEDAADAVAAYNPHRERPSSLEGLKKNLRLREDNRWHWHYDPRFISAARPSKSLRDYPTNHSETAARNIGRFGTPTLLVRGKMSDIVDPEHVEELLEMIPQATSVDVTGAGHMVAGDSNDIFNDSILEFLAKVKENS